MRIAKLDSPVEFLSANHNEYGYTVAGFPPGTQLSYEEQRVGHLVQGREYYQGRSEVTHLKVEGDVSPLSQRSGVLMYESDSHESNVGTFVFSGDGIIDDDGYRFTWIHVEQYGQSAFMAIRKYRRQAGYGFTTHSILTERIHFPTLTWQRGEFRWRGNGPYYDRFPWLEESCIASLRSQSNSPGSFSGVRRFRLPQSQGDPDRLIGALLKTFPYCAVKKPYDFDAQVYRDLLEGQQNFQGNMINFVSKAGSFGTSLRAALSLGADPTDPKKWASMWLAGRFSDRLLVKNVRDIYGGIARATWNTMEHRFNRSMARRTTSVEPIFGFWESGQMTSSCSLYCSNESETGLMTAVKKLYDWDAFPTLENAWDMVPFSFVVDWFLSVGDILDNIDKMVYQQYLKVELYERSDKLQLKPNLDWLSKASGYPSSCLSGITATYYHRYRASIPDLGVMDGWSPSLPSPTNCGDLTALAVQFLL